MFHKYSTEFKVGSALGLLGIVVGLLPSIFPMSVFLLWVLRILCALLLIATVMLWAEVKGQRRIAVRVLAVSGVLTGVLIGVACSSFWFGQRSQRLAATVKQPQPTFTDLGHLFLGYGYDAEHRCHAILNGSLLVQWRNDFRLALVCGIADPSIDEHSNKQITVSSLFTIEPTAVEISVQHRSKTANTIQHDINAQLAVVPKEARKSVGVEWSLWYRVVLLPPSVDPESIRQLDDVVKLGGMILPEERALMVVSTR